MHDHYELKSRIPALKAGATYRGRTR